MVRQSFLLILVAALTRGCATGPKLPRADVADLPGEAVPTAEDPKAWNYLPQVMRYANSEEELAVYRAWSGLPLEQARPALEALGIIRDKETVTVNGWTYERGWGEAVNSRHVLEYSYAYETPTGRRRGLIFLPGHGGGSGGNTTPALAIVTDESYVPVKIQKVQVFRRPIEGVQQRTDEGLEVTFEFKLRSREEVVEVETLRLQFESEGVRETRESRRPGQRPSVRG